MSSALIFHLQKTFAMSIFDFQVHLCADGSPPNMLPHNCKAHTFLPLSPAFTRAWPPLGIGVFRSCGGPRVTPLKGAPVSLVRQRCSLQGADSVHDVSFQLCLNFFLFCLYLRISLFVPTRCFLG